METCPLPLQALFLLCLLLTAGAEDAVALSQICPENAQQNMNVPWLNDLSGTASILTVYGEHRILPNYSFMAAPNLKVVVVHRFAVAPALTH